MSLDLPMCSSLGIHPVLHSMHSPLKWVCMLKTSSQYSTTKSINKFTNHHLTGTNTQSFHHFTQPSSVPDLYVHPPIWCSSQLYRSSPSAIINRDPPRRITSRLLRGDSLEPPLPPEQSIPNHRANKAHVWPHSSTRADWGDPASERVR